MYEDKNIMEDLFKLKCDLGREIDKLKRLNSFDRSAGKKSFGQKPSLSRVDGPDPSISKVPEVHLPEQQAKDIDATKEEEEQPKSNAALAEQEQERDIKAALAGFRTSLSSYNALMEPPKFNPRNTTDISDWTTAPQCTVLSIVNHPLFDVMMACVIAFNAITLCAEVEVSARRGESFDTLFLAFGIFFALCFLIELVLRLFAFKIEFFKDPVNWKWNIFDLGLVLFSAIDLSILLSGVSSEQSQTYVFFTAAKTMKMLRVLRIFRVFRLSRKLSELALMISDSLMNLVWALIMVMVIIFIFGIVIAETTGLWLQAALDPDNEGLNWLALSDQSTGDVFEMGKRFGTISRTAASLLQIMLGGMDWADVVEASTATGVLVPLMLYTFIAFTMLAVLNVVTGVFVDSALENTKKLEQYKLDKAKDQEKLMMDQLHRFFMRVDKNGDGILTQGELLAMLKHEDLLAVLGIWGFRADDVSRLYTVLDENHDGEITFSEFAEQILRLQGPARSIDLHFLAMDTGHGQRRLTGGSTTPL
eukprot:TRINITY_DN26908_c0_g1_i1.p1 TRINITY_DN26908_c0_g1~~TRINITY_DN26908_c0_g1_i1.p1  ORF type:complete len:533 (-),score=112.79 TRINITY_DN26908_c0_g1_i1:268-1866(-)